MITKDDVIQLYKDFTPKMDGSLSKKLIMEMYENFQKDEQFINQNIVVAANLYDTKEEVLNYIWVEYLTTQIFILNTELEKPINLVRID